MENMELLRQAYEIATLSPDPSTQIGSFLISYSGQIETLTFSFNRPTTGWHMTEEDWVAPRKYTLMEHAERGAIYKAARHGISTAGGTLVSTWAACADCARAIVAADIVTLIRHVPPYDEASARWAGSVELGDQIMKAGGVEIVDVYGPIYDAKMIKRAGQRFDPTNHDEMALD